jgi:hypothetical protein
MTTLGVFRDDVYNIASVLPVAKYTTDALASGTLTAARITGGTEVYYKNTAATALTTDTAVNIIAAIVSAIQTAAPLLQPTNASLQNVTYTLYIWTSAGGLTITAGTGVTITGTATVATNVERQYMVTVTSPTTVTLQDLGGAAVT